VTVYGQLESPSPAHGSVLVQGGVLYLTAGRSSYLDGGVDLLRVEADTGKVLSRTPLYSPDRKTGRQPAQFGPAYMPGMLEDILSTDGSFVYLRDTVFDQNGKVQAKGNPHLLTLTGFLDSTYAHRSYWLFGRRCSLSTGCSGRDRSIVSGRLLVLNGKMIYGYGRARVHWSNALEDGPYQLFAQKQGEPKPQWTKQVPIQVRAMILAGKVLFAAGPPADAVSRPEGPRPDERSVLMAFSAADGKELARGELGSPPVFDGMAAAGGKLYITLEGGSVACMAGK
jgi:hypothetical protein